MIKTEVLSGRVPKLPTLVAVWPPIITAAIFLLLGVITVSATVTANPSDGIRCLLFALIFGVLWIALQASPKVGICALVAYLCFLGVIRRSLIFTLGWQPLDPLALVGPTIALFFFLNMFLSKNLTVDTTISKVHLAVFSWMIVEVLNPQQGDTVVGASGALIYLVPMTWFFVGRIMGTLNVTRKMYWTICVIAIIAMLYGLKQAMLGFSLEEQAWIKASNMNSLNVGDTIRAVSFFTSGAEYCTCLSLGSILCWAAFLRGKRLAFLPIPPLLAAIILDSSRGALLCTLATMAVLFAIQSKSLWAWLPRLVIALSLAAFGLIFCMKLLQSTNAPVQTAGLVQHETTGLLNPEDDSSSTANVHSNMVIKGIGLGFTHPFGIGLGASTDAGLTVDATYGTTEVDISNMFESLGFLGGTVYAVLIGIVLLTAIKYWRAARSFESLSMLGVLIVTLGLWLTGKQYSSALVIWFTIGALDRNWRRIKSENTTAVFKFEEATLRQIEVEPAAI